MNAAVPFSTRAPDYRERVNSVLARVLPTPDQFPETLNDAMRYSVLGGGKRVRPLLAYATGEVLGVPPERIDPVAAAIELIHAFSLVHDDLPAMDDDDLRRGRPTTHKAFDEATAILAGDALQIQAFTVLATDAALIDDPAAQIALVRTLSDATGVDGMTGGQAMDLASAGKRLTLTELERMHERKTGVLIRAAVIMAWQCARPAAPKVGEALGEFARLIGLAFQIRDDILDIEADTETLGKPQGSDVAQDKATYPAILGMDEAKARADRLFDGALKVLDDLSLPTEPLAWMARYIVQRDH
ncbi:MAG: polyprenyl synthetase family protein [Gammaproteobacteria bacterium]